jgi:UDP-2,3-diacylglucosamine pyrophosphatase LpxH
MPKNRLWQFERLAHNVHRLTVDIGKVDQTVEPLWLADVHWDNPKCDWRHLRRTLDQAMAKDSPIFIIGDFFCAMQGKYDKRSHKEDVRPEHRVGKYLDALVETAVDWWKPYGSNLVLVTEGNHESKILERHETNLLDRFAAGMRSAGGITEAGAYDGFIQQTLKASGVGRGSWAGYYHHGYGGGGPVTKGAIDFNRLAEQVTADFYVMGHIHRSMTIENAVRCLNIQGVIETRQRDYVRLSTFKDEGQEGHGFAVEKGMGVRFLGGKWQIISMRHENRDKVFSRQWLTVV